jgi:hypothetical protein
MFQEELVTVSNILQGPIQPSIHYRLIIIINEEHSR